MIERDDRGVVKPDKMQISFGGGIEKLKSNEFLPEGFSIIEEWREHFQLDEIPHDRTKCFASGSITLRRCKEEGENSQRGVRGRQWKWTIVQLVVLSVRVCVCVFAAFYDRSLRQESWYFIVILFHEYVSVSSHTLFLAFYLIW